MSVESIEVLQNTKRNRTDFISSLLTAAESEKMFVVCFGLIQLFFALAKGENCQTLAGTWFDEYGSELALDFSLDGTLFGQYTLVTGSNGSHPLIGMGDVNKTGAVFGFNIPLNEGGFIKSWTGQCLMCGGQETLQTSFLVRQRVAYSDENLSTYAGTTAFTRSSPVKHREFPTGKKVVSHRVRRAPSTRQTCALDGHWYNDLGSEMDLTHHANGTITGRYHTAVESYPGAAGGNFSEIFGYAVPSQPDGAFAWHVIWSNGTSITGFAGQCRLCNGGQTEILYTAWVLRARLSSCDDNWESTNLGENVFTRYQQTGGGNPICPP